MPERNWTDAIVGDRMTVDREFSQRVRDSQFSNQEWGLIMTATDLEIENAENPEEARLVADTENLPGIMPELDNVREGMQAMGGGGDGDSSSGGLLSSVKDALGFGGGGGGVDQDRLEAAEALAQEYADQLQDHLEEEGKWEQVCIAYQS